MEFLDQLGVSEEEFLDLVQSTTSIAQMLTRLGRARVGSNYTLIREAITSLEVSTTHWTRSASRPAPPTLDQILVKDSPFQLSTSQKRKVLATGQLGQVCVKCGVGGWWQNEPLVLRLDHINGDSRDNRIENLRLLCPNCDSQTPTFCGRNKKPGKPKIVWSCLGCGVDISKGSVWCRSCGATMGNRSRSHSDWPEDATLVEEVRQSSFEAVGRKYGVSGNAVRKRLRVRGCLSMLL
jgi:hypothetical protein